MKNINNRKFMKQKKPKINTVGWQQTRVKNNKINKVQASRFWGDRMGKTREGENRIYEANKNTSAPLPGVGSVCICSIGGALQTHQFFQIPPKINFT